jgi:penicillin-binding protein 2
MLANDLGVDTIHDYMKRFGFGELTGIDIPGEQRGLLPSTDWKRHAYKKPEQQKWYAGETISLGIGQGYNGFTIVQLADSVAALANHGVRMKPHLVEEIIDEASKKVQKVQPEVIGRMDVKPEHLQFVVNAMIGVNKEGTAAADFVNTPYVSAGKTGTAQVLQIAQNEKYNASKVDERHRDHALFIAFAPADDPKIALAMVVENGGFGAAAAGPIARRVFDYELLGQYPSEEDMEAVREGKATAPVGTPRGLEAAWPPAGTSNNGTPDTVGGGDAQQASALQGQTMLAAFMPQAAASAAPATTEMGAPAGP